LKIPSKLEFVSTKIKYEHIFTDVIQLLNEEIKLTEGTEETKLYNTQDMKDVVDGFNKILTSVKGGDANNKYLLWLSSEFEDCLFKNKNCNKITSKNCVLSAMDMLPYQIMPINCIDCVIYALKYASHSKQLLMQLSNIQNCNDENNFKLMNSSTDISLVREYQMYERALSKLEVSKNL
ncbi:conserved protein, unknown function, partial [Hepatocystis sp. ex Piliocolobus tephrosceles]